MWLLFCQLMTKVKLMEELVPYSQLWNWVWGEIEYVVCIIRMTVGRANWDHPQMC